MSKPQHDRVQSLRTGGRPANPGPASSTFNSSRMPGLLMTDESTEMLSPVEYGDSDTDKCLRRNKNFFRQQQAYSGRPFNPLVDISRATAQNARFCSPDRSSAVANTSDDTSYYFFKSPPKSSGRPTNPFCDVPGNRLARVQQQQARKQLSQKECEMGKTKKCTLQHLKEEQQMPRCDARPQAQSSNVCKRTRQHLLAKDRNQQRREVYSHNIPTLNYAGTAGRQLNLDTDGQRTRSCPTPERGETTNTSVQRIPRVYQQRPAQSGHGSPSRSKPTPEHQTAAKYLRIEAENLTRPTVATDNTGVTKNPRSIQKSPDRSPERTNLLKERPLQLQEQRQTSQYKSNVGQDFSGQLYMEYGQTPARATPETRHAVETPLRPLYVTDEFTNATLNQTDLVSAGPPSTHPDTKQRERLADQENEVTTAHETVGNQIVTLTTAGAAHEIDPHNANFEEIQRVCHSTKQGRSSPRRTPSPTTQICPQQDKFYYNASIFNEPPSYYRRNPTGGHADKTQYILDDMDISNEALPTCPPHYIRTEESSNIRSLRIPPEDLTCFAPSHTSQKSNLCPSTMKASAQIISTPCNTLENELDSTEYLEFPSNLKAPSYYPTQICRPCEQPKAMPQKSVEPLQSQIMDQSVRQMCDEVNVGAPALCSTSIYGDTTYGLRDLYNTQCTEAANEPPASVKECARAKRCGQVQFDNSDKQERQDHQRNALRKAEIENLVNDTFCPGLIQETIDGQEDFNKHSLNLFLCSYYGDPFPADPMTLLEAFSIRIDKEKAEIMKDSKEYTTEEQIVDSIEQHFADKNPTDLNRCIRNFLLSEHRKDFEQTEKAKGISFEADVQKWATDWPGSTKFKFISYTGRTKPSEHADETA